MADAAEIAVAPRPRWQGSAAKMKDVPSTTLDSAAARQAAVPTGLPPARPAAKPPDLSLARDAPRPAEPPSPIGSARGARGQRRAPKWHIVYYVLAAFDLATVCGALILSHEIMAIYRTSVVVNEGWAGHLAALSALGQHAGAVNAPGNDIFDSHDVAGEERRQEIARQSYEGHFAELRADIVLGATPKQAQDLNLRLDSVEVAMSAMLAEAEQIFAFFRTGQAESAGQRMASMDRRFADLSTAIAVTARAVRAIQADLFKEQVAEALFLRRFEYLFGGIIFLMVGCVTVYGHRIAREFKLGEEERARYLRELEDKEETLRLRVAELSDARSASRAKSDFLAHMSHELRTPLNAIIGFSETMKEGVLGPVDNPRYREYLGDIHDSGRHLLAIINDILDMSKIEAGKAELHEEECRLADIVQSALRLVRARAEAGGVTIGVEMPARLPTMRADARALKQIMLNLLSNAVKFTRDGGRVDVRAEVTPGAEARVMVSDTGIGMRKEDIGIALAPFGQIRNSTMNAHEGTGIGLPIAASLMRLHGGSLEIESAPDRGTTITLTFPAERVLTPKSARARELA